MTTSLECNHCGGAAITSRKNLFGEDDSDRCDECGFPGQVSVDEDGYDENDEPICIATWDCSEDVAAKCNRPGCEECK